MKKLLVLLLLLLSTVTIVRPQDIKENRVIIVLKKAAAVQKLNQAITIHNAIGERIAIHQSNSKPYQTVAVNSKFQKIIKAYNITGHTLLDMTKDLTDHIYTQCGAKKISLFKSVYLQNKRINHRRWRYFRS